MNNFNGNEILSEHYNKIEKIEMQMKKMQAILEKGCGNIKLKEP